MDAESKRELNNAEKQLNSLQTKWEMEDNKKDESFCNVRQLIISDLCQGSTKLKKCTEKNYFRVIMERWICL